MLYFNSRPFLKLFKWYNLGMTYFVYVTFPSKKEAQKVAKSTIQQRLTGCANIFPIESIYWWKNKIVNNKEAVAIFKTTKTKLKKLQQEIKKLHPYNVPCIAPIEISQINKEYQNWLKGELK